MLLFYSLQGKSHLCIPFLGIARPQPQFPHSCVCERFIYSQDPSKYFPAAEYADRSLKHINQICECRNGETEHYNSVLEITVSFLHCEKSLFVLASRQKIPVLMTENPAVDTRTICLLPIEFF
jgi:hypothetical protein